MSDSRFSVPFFPVIVICLFLLLSSVAMCQGADQPTDLAVMQAQMQQALAQAKQATAEAESAMYKAQIGQISATLPTGKTTATNLNIEGTILAYQAADTATNLIAKAVIDAKTNKVVFFSTKEITNMARYQAFLAQAELLQSRIPNLTKMPTLLTDVPCKLPPEDKKAAPPLLVIDTALQILALFKVDRTISGHDVTLDEFAVYALVAAKLKAATT